MNKRKRKDQPAKDGGHATPETSGAEPPQRRFERRFHATKNISHRAGRGGKRFITGSFAVYDAPTELMPGLIEKVARGCFTQTMRVNDIAGLFNHDNNLILGRNVSGTMTIADGSDSCDYEIEADERQTYTSNLLISIDRGDVRGSSFGFSPEEEGLDYDRATDTVTRTLKRVTLYDVGPVVFPQYTQTNGLVETKSALVVGDLDFEEIAAAAERLRAGAVDPNLIALVERAKRSLSALIPVTGPTAEERARHRARVLTLARRRAA